MPADGKIIGQVTFAEPGTYVLRGLADDGALFGSDEVTVIGDVRRIPPPPEQRFGE